MGFSTLYWFYIEEDTQKEDLAMMMLCAQGYSEAREAFFRQYPEADSTFVTVLTPGETIGTLAQIQTSMGKPGDADSILTIVLTAERVLKEKGLKEVTLATGIIKKDVGGYND